MTRIEQGFETLIQVYRQAKFNEFGLFLGAGINLPPDKKIATRYKTYTWGKLLEALYEQNAALLEETFAQASSRHGDDWIKIADRLQQKVGEKDLIGQIDQLFYDDLPRSDKDRRLSKQFIDQAPTLRAVIAFASEVKARTRSGWTFKRNPRIGRVITTNYDYFFGAGWTRYEAFKSQWKVRTPFGRREPLRKGQAPIDYIHGYLPYSKHQTEGLVLTAKSYLDAYREGGFAADALRQAVSQYSLIFVGISFSDPPLLSMLKEIPVGERPPHFAIVLPNLAATMAGLGITPVVVENYAQIPEKLFQVYTTGLSTETCRQVDLPNSDQYWSRLLLGKGKDDLVELVELGLTS